MTTTMNTAFSKHHYNLYITYFYIILSGIAFFLKGNSDIFKPTLVWT